MYSMYLTLCWEEWLDISNRIYHNVASFQIWGNTISPKQMIWAHGKTDLMIFWSDIFKHKFLYGNGSIAELCPDAWSVCSRRNVLRRRENGALDCASATKTLETVSEQYDPKWDETLAYRQCHSSFEVTELCVCVCRLFSLLLPPGVYL